MRTFKSLRTQRSERMSAKCSRMGKASQVAQAAKRMELAADHVYPPMRGDLLMVDRVTNVIQGASVEYVICVGDRINRIEVRSFGRLIPSVKTWTAFFDVRRRRMAAKWLTV